MSATRGLLFSLFGISTVLADYTITGQIPDRVFDLQKAFHGFWGLIWTTFWWLLGTIGGIVFLRILRYKLRPFLTYSTKKILERHVVHEKVIEKYKDKQVVEGGGIGDLLSLIIIDPTQARVPAKGGVLTFKCFNPTDTRFVFKLRCTNNKLYQLDPVYGFLEPKGRCEITGKRLDGPPGFDKITVQLFALKSMTEDDPQKAIDQAKPIGELSIQVEAVEKKSVDEEEKAVDAERLKDAVELCPPVVRVPVGGGLSRHSVRSKFEKRLVFKIKSTNNEQYRTDPVWGFIEPQGSAPLDVLRLTGFSSADSKDKLFINFAITDDGAKDAQMAFEESNKAGSVTVPIQVQDDGAFKSQKKKGDDLTTWGAAPGNKKIVKRKRRITGAPVEMTVTPKDYKYSAKGDESRHILENKSDERLVFKLRSSNNDYYRIIPVFGFIEPHAKVDLRVVRLPGPTGDDLFLAQWAVADPDDDDAFIAFESAPMEGEVEMNVLAE